MSDIIKKTENTKISKHQFYFETSLYEKISINKLENEFFENDIDGFSYSQLEPTTYSISCGLKNREGGIYKLNDYNMYSSIKWYFWIDLKCKRKWAEIITIFILIDDEYITKVWQYPSLADINSAEIRKKYSKVVSNDDLTNLTKAIWLFSHWIWAGSFVYLRRIFEKLIFETYILNKEKIWLEEQEFKLKKMIDKVDILKNFLPEHLVKMSTLYRILSSGVHNLSEQECLTYFKSIKLSIELILKQKIKIQNEKEEEFLVEKEINSINQEISKWKQ